MDLSEVSYEELLEEILDRVPSDVDKREGSIIYDAVAPCAYFLARQAWLINGFVDLVFPDTAAGEYLDKAVAAFGIARKAATRAIRIMETTDAVDMGTRWGIGELVYVVIGMEDENRYLVECETPGTTGNQLAGKMTPVSNIINVDAELTGIETAGTDQETDDELRQRFYIKVRSPATSGNAHHYKLWAMEVPGVGDVKVYPLDNGPGTVTVMIVNSEKEVDSSLENKVAEYIETVRPIGAAVSVCSPVTAPITVDAKVVPDGTRTLFEIQQAFEERLDGFLKNMVFQEYRVSYARIGSLLLETDGVQDYEQLKINGGTGNVAIGDRSIPICGSISLQEVERLAAE